MPYSFPVSPSVLLGRRAGWISLGTAFLSNKNNKNNKKTAMYKLSCSKPQKNEDNND